MSTSDLAHWLDSHPTFQSHLNGLIGRSVNSQFNGNFHPAAEFNGAVPNIRYLLLSASVLAQSTATECQDAALRISTYALVSDLMDSASKSAATTVLNDMANRRAIELASEREYIPSSYPQQLPFPSRIDWTRRTLSQSVYTEMGHSLFLNRFQRELWDSLQSSRWVSCTAPTSAGKSYVIEQWLVDYIGNLGRGLAVVLVPSRALISQVESDLRAAFEEYPEIRPYVSSVPMVDQLQPEGATVFVFTQERLHILLSSFEREPAIDVMVVDEAQKVGDGHRGVLLQQVLERTYSANPLMRVVFASPQANNPQALLEDASPDTPTTVVTGGDVTVSQNLIWATQVYRKPREWNLELCRRDSNLSLGTLTLPYKPGLNVKRLSSIAFALGHDHPGNIIYVNGAAEAEKVSGHIYDYLGPNSSVEDDELSALAELTANAIHPKYRLTAHLARGVAFHYGNMPLLIKTEIERLFTIGKIRYLVCTSTLVEGVNMACRNIFLRGPKKGIGRPMNEEDFWNLAGRAGRWGQEFQGNIFCIDPRRDDVWKSPAPRYRSRYTIRRTAEDVVARSDSLIAFIDAGSPLQTARSRPELEYVFSYLCAEWLQFGSIRRSGWARRIDADRLAQITHRVSSTCDALEVDRQVVLRNPGISPTRMDSLLQYFRAREKPIQELLPADPQSEDVVNNFVRIFVRLYNHMTLALGPNLRAFALSLLVTRWMRGFPLRRLIDDRWEYYQKSGSNKTIDTTIREVMQEVEQIARFEAPKYIACYCDVLRQHLEESGHLQLADELDNYSIYLEFGVSTQTEISLIGVGLSRTASIHVSEHIVRDNLTQSAVIEWLSENQWLLEHGSLPVLVRHELRKLLDRHRPHPM